MHYLYESSTATRLELPSVDATRTAHGTRRLRTAQTIVREHARPRSRRLASPSPAPIGAVDVVVPIVAGDRVARHDHRGELRARARVRRSRGAPAHHHRRQHGRGARERAPVRRDAAAAEGDRAAHRRAGGDQQHPAGDGASSTSRRSSTWSATSCARCSTAGDIGIRWWDEGDRHARRCTPYEHGERLHHQPSPLKPRRRVAPHAARRERWSLDTRAEQAALRIRASSPGTDRQPLDACVPILGGDRVLGLMLIENHEREHAFGEAEVRLLTTVAASMGVALENARLFDETQRLLKETEQRDAELAVINSIQQGMAASSTSRRSSTSSATSCARCFKTGDIGIRWRDEHGPGPLPVRVRARRALVRAADAAPTPGVIVERMRDARAARRATRAGARRAARCVTLPAPTSACRACSCRSSAATACSARSSSRTTSASTPSARPTCACCTTVAASMGVALENARLFDETQRLLKETEQRTAELRSSTASSRACAAELDFQAIVDAGRRQAARGVRASATIGIRWYDSATRRALPLRVRARRAPDHAAVRHRALRTSPGRDAPAHRAQRPLRRDARPSRHQRRRAPTRSLSRASAFRCWRGDRVLGVDRASRATSASTRSARPRCALLRRSRRAWAWRSRTPACSTRRSAARARRRRWPRSGARSSRRSTSTVMDRIAAQRRTCCGADNSAIFLPRRQAGSTTAPSSRIGEIAERTPRDRRSSRATASSAACSEAGTRRARQRHAADPRGIQIAGTGRGRRTLMVAPLAARRARSKARWRVWRTGGRPFDDANSRFLTGLARQAPWRSRTRACSTRPRRRSSSRPRLPRSCA